jgi:hypothetical protein
MGLILKHVEKTKSGSWQYRRRIPKDVAEVIMKREFKRKLGDSDWEAIAAYARYHAAVEREIAEAKLGRVRSEVARSPQASEREAYAEALLWRAELVALGASQEDLEIAADNLADEYP